MKTQRIVVGYDGSDEARWAVSWAAGEAERIHAQLQIVHAYQITWPGAYYAAVTEITQAAEQEAETLITDIVAQIRARGTGIDIVGTTVQAPPATALLDIAEAGGCLLVVGSHGAGSVRSLLLGSVSQQVATHAPVPVVVVRGRSAAETGPVVVGVDGSPATDTALGLAFEAAAARGAALVAIRSYVAPARPMLPVSEIEALERAALDASLTGWREKYPDVEVEALLAVGHAANVLVGVSHTAQLVVVGSRGHGGFTGLLLGSVGQRLMHHAECPVLIAHVRKTK